MLGLFLLAVALVMMCTMSWSATPGAGKHLSTSDGRFVKNKSSVALWLWKSNFNEIKKGHA
jgi:hypothetical protein